MARPDKLLEIGRLHIAFRMKAGERDVLRDLSFSIERGQIVGLSGESGCGKTTAALAILGLLPSNAVVRGSARFEGRELIGAPEPVLNDIRGARIAMIFQEPLLSLNPVLRAVDQVEQVLRAHARLSAAERKDRSRTALQRAGLTEPRLQQAYPHQLSGGQRQRVAIAQAIVCEPSLLIADEPTCSLDAISAREILMLLRDQARRLNTSMLLITHDARALRSIADHTLTLDPAIAPEAVSHG